MHDCVPDDTLFDWYSLTTNHWEPALANALAARRPVLLIDSAGIGRSEGEIPDTFTGWAAHYFKVDVLGYSMGGCVAQLMAVNAPEQVTGDGVKPSPDGKAFKRLKAARTMEERRAFEDGLFVRHSERSREAGMVRCEPVPPGPAHKQALAFVRFMDKKNVAEGSYNRLRQLRLPVLIANESDADVQLICYYLPNNSILIWKMLSFADARLHLFPDSGHGFPYQYADEFAKLVNDFLGANSSSSSRGSRI
ncbi:Alpha/Beta hydrolase protein [Trichoderma ceciliae]